MSPKPGQGAGLAALLENPIYAIPLVLLVLLFALMYLHDVRKGDD